MGGYNIFSAAPAYYAKDIVDALAYGDKPELSQFFLVGFGLILIFFFRVPSTLETTTGWVT